jgi:hypothetical protein
MRAVFYIVNRYDYTATILLLELPLCKQSNQTELSSILKERII